MLRGHNSCDLLSSCRAQTLPGEKVLTQEHNVWDEFLLVKPSKSRWGISERHQLRNNIKISNVS